MARITLPKLGSVEDVPTWAAITVVVILTVGALFGLAIWQGLFDGDSSPATTTTSTTTTSTSTTIGPAREPFTYGDDPFLDELWDECENSPGQSGMDACFDLFFESPVGSDYEAFAEEMLG